MVTRRCTQRQYLLRPDPDTNNAFLYCIIVSAQKYDVNLLDFVQMSNHLHDEIYATRKGRIEAVWPIVGRGKLR